MLTNIRIKGFKNLKDVSISFGPFTCIAGENGVGKSNLFDALMFLRDLTDHTIIEAAARVRDPDARSGDPAGLFSVSKTTSDPRMSFDCDMIVPVTVVDDFGRKCEPSLTYLKYKVEFGLDRRREQTGGAGIYLAWEELTYVQKGDARKRLGFPHSKKFLDSVVKGRRTKPLISSEIDDSRTIVKLHQDGGSRGPAFKVPARFSPRTILGGTNTTDQPTVLAARREMQRWTLLQLEPSALRRPDDFSADPHVSPQGEHLPATLARLNSNFRIATELSELIPEIREVEVDSDEGRRLRTINVVLGDNASYPARALSDGTLRFLALAVLRNDPDAGRLICLEEPENGIHPLRIPSIVNLLRRLAVDPEASTGEDNPMRQVIVNTHSPLVLGVLEKDCLVLARSVASRSGRQTEFFAIGDTWRTAEEAVNRMQPIALGVILELLTGETSRYRVAQDSGKSLLSDFLGKQGQFPFMLSDPVNGRQ